VRLEIDGLRGDAFHSRIDYIAPALDPRTRTALARIRLENPKGILRAHMYGRATIQVGAAPGNVAVPRDALQRAHGVSLVFVCLNDSLFETRRVNWLSNAASESVLGGGVDAGEQVVTTGSFLLKTETLKESIGPGCCEIEEN
jgi:cobalt-zinc-cadmium efflux system membrane fusion protein